MSGFGPTENEPSFASHAFPFSSLLFPLRLTLPTVVISLVFLEDLGESQQQFLASLTSLSFLDSGV